MSNYVKECPGCFKPFNRNRSRKKHILGHTYKNKQGETITCKPCPMVPDQQRQELAYIYKLVPAKEPVKIAA